jgi:hypothetical protein
MRRHLKRILFIAAVVTVSLFGSATKLHAGFITGELWVNQTTASGNALLGYGQVGNGLYLGTPDATFNSGAFNYNSTVGGNSSANYTIGGFLNNPVFTNTSAKFTSNGGAGATLNNSYFYFTGTISLNAGNNSFVVSHDDGLQLNIDTIGLVVNAPGPSSPSNTPFNVNAPTAGDYAFELSYGETLGAPAELIWSVNGVTVTSTTPEPGSLALLGMGAFSMLGYAWRRKRQKVS